MPQLVKPNIVPRVNWAHPLAKNLFSCLVPEGELTTRSLPNYFQNLPNINSFSFGPQGKGVYIEATFTTSMYGYDEPVGKERSITPSFFVFGDFLTDGGIAPFEKFLSHCEGYFGNDGSAKVRTFNGDDILVNSSGYFSYPSVSYGYSGAVGAGGRFYKNGQYWGSGGSAAAGWPRSFRRSLIFGGLGTATEWYYVAYMFDRPLTDAEHAMLAADPFGLLDFSFQIFDALISQIGQKLYPPQGVVYAWQSSLVMPVHRDLNSLSAVPENPSGSLAIEFRPPPIVPASFGAFYSETGAGDLGMIYRSLDPQSPGSPNPQSDMYKSNPNVRPLTNNNPRINPRHPLARDLVLCIVPHVGDLVSGAPPVALGPSASFGPTRLGMALKNASTDYAGCCYDLTGRASPLFGLKRDYSVFILTSELITSYNTGFGPFTVKTSVNGFTALGAGRGVGSFVDSFSYNYADWSYSTVVFRSWGNGSGQRWWTDNGAANSEVQATTWSHDSAGNWAVTGNGQVIIYDPTTDATNNDIRWGEQIVGVCKFDKNYVEGSGGGAPGNVHMVAVFKRALSLPERRMLELDPFGIVV